MTALVRKLSVALVALVLLCAACSADSDTDSATDDTDATANPSSESTSGSSATGDDADDTLHILLTNDDGVAGEGIDALATALSELPDTDVTVIAPADDKTGTSDQTTPGSVTAEQTTTASGYPAMAVQGFPADSVIWALEESDLAQPPDLVVSGINEGQNIGPVAALSGTVGAAREAARRGLPSLAASAGVVTEGDEVIVDYDDAVDLVVGWVEANRDELLVREPSSDPADVANLNVPTCVTGEMRGQVDVPVATATGGINIFAVDCASTLEDPPDDVVAFVNGFAPLSELNVTDLDAQLESATINS